uniref:Uncharacterized protein n=1 Tax=Arion vulgaris TaxID=1028688 RepID=A0A0B7A198_9EUPU
MNVVSTRCDLCLVLHPAELVFLRKGGKMSIQNMIHRTHKPASPPSGVDLETF